jgi:pyruvate/2-oxoglutarate dehydrogenase complex dihydrolipoamide dehydrogenase (E3) component
MPANFDSIIIGAGQAGPTLAGRLTQSGRRLAFIERKLFGGTCVNTGCTPTKAMVASAYVAQKARTAATYGVTLQGAVSVDMKAVMARKDKIVLDSRNGLEKYLRGMKNCTVFEGHAHFESPKEVRVGDNLLTANEIFLNVGGRAVVPDFPGVDSVPWMDNVGILELETLPKHLIVVGGSYVGLEFGQIFRRFGSEVTIIEKSPRLVSREDEDVSASIRSFLEKEGIHIRTSAECIHFTPQGNDIAAGVDCTDDPSDSIGSHVLLAVGRRPNTDDLGLDKAGIAHDERGFITVDDQLRTNVPGIWALGDCNRRGAFTHTAYNDFEIVASNLLDPILPDQTPRPRRSHRSRGAQIRQTCAHRYSSHDQGWPRRRKRRDRRIHQDPRRRNLQTDSWRLHPRNRRRRSHPLHPRHHVRPRSLYRHAARRTHPPHRL